MALDLPFAPPPALKPSSAPEPDQGAAIVIPAIAPDGSLFAMEKLAAHRAGQLHLAVSVFVFSGEALLIQQRAAGKYHCAGQWANSCCSHPHWGEAPDHSAQRRLFEELGLRTSLRQTSMIDYAAAVTNGLFEHERVHVFRGDVDAARVRLSPDPSEVAAVRWARPADLMAEAAAQPDAFAPWFRIYLQRWSELGLV